jgi:hypothetical protein
VFKKPTNALHCHFNMYYLTPTYVSVLYKTILRGFKTTGCAGQKSVAVRVPRLHLHDLIRMALRL